MLNNTKQKGASPSSNIAIDHFFELSSLLSLLLRLLSNNLVYVQIRTYGYKEYSFQLYYTSDLLALLADSSFILVLGLSLDALEHWSIFEEVGDHNESDLSASQVHLSLSMQLSIDISSLTLLLGAAVACHSY